MTGGRNNQQRSRRIRDRRVVVQAVRRDLRPFRVTRSTARDPSVAPVRRDVRVTSPGSASDTSGGST